MDPRLEANPWDSAELLGVPPGSILTAVTRPRALQGRAAITRPAPAEGHAAENAHSLEELNSANSHVNWNEDLELQVRTRPGSTLCDLE